MLFSKRVFSYFDSNKFGEKTTEGLNYLQQTSIEVHYMG